LFNFLNLNPNYSYPLICRTKIKEYPPISQFNNNQIIHPEIHLQGQSTHSSYGAMAETQPNEGGMPKEIEQRELLIEKPKEGIDGEPKKPIPVRRKTQNR
jgi:hypothetical protein